MPLGTAIIGHKWFVKLMAVLLSVGGVGAVYFFARHPTCVGHNPPLPIQDRRTAFDFDVDDDELLLLVVCKKTGHPFVDLQANWTGQDEKPPPGFPEQMSGDEGSNMIIVRRNWPFNLIYHDRNPGDCALTEHISRNVLNFDNSYPRQLIIQCHMNHDATPLQLASR